MHVSENEEGITLIELLIVLGLLAIVISAVFSLYTLGIYSFGLSEKNSDAKYAATRAAAFITNNVRLTTEIEILNSIPAAEEGYCLIFLQSGRIKYQDGSNTAINIPISDVNFQLIQFSPNADRNTVLSFSLTTAASNNSYTLNSEIFLVNLAAGIANTPETGSVIRFRKNTSSD